MNEVLLCEIEPNNPYDRHAVSVKKAGEIVGHIPRENSKVFKFFIRRGGHITATVTGPKVNRGLYLGLEVPVDYSFVGKEKDTSALCALLKQD